MATITPRHRTPRIYPLSRSAVTSFQLLNIIMLAVWTYDLLMYYEQYQRVPSMEALRLFGNVYWWAWFVGIVLVLNTLPLIPWWARRINRTYILKRVGLTTAAMWWAFLAGIFWVATPSDLFVGIHVALALGCLFEAMRLVRVA